MDNTFKYLNIIKDLTDELLNLKKENDNMKDIINNLTKENEIENNDKYEEQKNIIKNLNDEIIILKNENEYFKNENDNLKNEIKNLKNFYDNLIEQNNKEINFDNIDNIDYNNIDYDELYNQQVKELNKSKNKIK